MLRCPHPCFVPASRVGCASPSAWARRRSARDASRPIPGVDLVASTLEECLAAAERHHGPMSKEHDIEGRSFELLLGRSRGCISTATVRRDVLLEAGGFPNGYTCAEDWVMFINVARYTDWCYLDRRLSFLRKHPGNNTVTNPTNDLVSIRALREVLEPETPGESLVEVMA